MHPFTGEASIRLAAGALGTLDCDKPIVAVFAQLRVDTIRENTRLGLEYARAQGRVGGRPTMMTPERIEAARLMREQNPPATWESIAKTLNVGSATVRRALAEPARDNATA